MPWPRSRLSLGFNAPSREAVDAFWRADVAHGGTDDGPPGLRPEEDCGKDYFACFLVDPEG